MTIGKKTGKASIEASRKIAKLCSVDVLGWNDQIGKEFISVNGDGDKLLLFQKEMEKEGWFTWPVNEDQEGAFMDFGMSPPPARLEKKPPIHEETPSIVYTGTDFHYSGVTRSFPGYVSMVSLVVPVIIIGLNNAFHFFHRDFYSFIIVLLGCIVITSIVIAPLDWIRISADQSKLTIRRPFLRKTKEIPLSDVRKIGFFTNRSSRSRRTWKNVEIYLTTGKRLDLFLADRVQDELVSFIKSKI